MSSVVNISELTHPIVAAVVLMMECAALGGPVMGKRKEHFSEEFLTAEFGAKWKEETGKPVPKYGYPDTGNGRFSRAWNVAQWLDFNKTMRIHLNLVELLPFLMFAILLGGVFAPWNAGMAGYLICIGRILYHFGYRISPNWRGLGAWPTYIGATWLVTIIVSGLRAIPAH